MCFNWFKKSNPSLNVAVNPSKVLCIKCAHHTLGNIHTRRVDRTGIPMCERNLGETVNLVTGVKTYYRIRVPCSKERLYVGACGPEGKFYVAK